MPLQNSNGNVSGGKFFAAYVGPSMNPTLREPEIMEIMPYDKRPLRVGDVAFFLPPEADQPVVHRIIRVTPAGISTLGDNNTQEDTLLLQPKSIKGRVVAAWRGQKRRKIAGGYQGRLTSRWLHWRRVLNRGASPLLHPLYQALSHWRLIARVLPAPFRPRVVVFQAQGRDQFQLLLGHRIIGRYDDHRHQWQIQRPFHLFVDGRALPSKQDRDRVKKRSWKTDEKYLNVHLIPFFGSMELSEITPEHVSEFVKRDKDGVKSSTVNKHLQVLRKMMNVAVDYRYEIKKNPVRAFHFSSEAGFRRIRVLSSEEEEKLVKVASPHLKSIIQFALDTGLRLQEILTLQTEDVDFGQEVIRIRPEVNKSGKHDFIPLLPRPKELISNLKAANGGRTSFVFNYLDPHTNELRPIRSIQHAFQTACRKAGITGLQFRDLRRTFSTRLHEKGLGLLIIQRLLRHSSPRISAEVYIQTSMRMMKEALEKISSREEKPANLEHGTDGKRQAASKPLVFSELE